MLQVFKDTVSAKADLLGISSSFLCAVYCLAFPIWITTGNIFNYLNQTHWHGLDYIFILVGFLAVGISSRSVSNPAIKLGFWSAITLYSLSILLHHVWAGMVYLSASASLTLIVLHFIHGKFYKKCAWFTKCAL